MSRLGSDFATMYGRELDRLATEIDAYESEEALWTTVGAQKNAPGTLALHTVGAINGRIGADVGGTGYVRDRDREFSERDVSKAEIIRRIHDCRRTVVPILEELDAEQLADRYPGQSPPAFPEITTQGMLMHLLWHLGWHVGHIYYHRLGMAGS